MTSYKLVYSECPANCMNNFLCLAARRSIFLQRFPRKSLPDNTAKPRIADSCTCCKEKTVPSQAAAKKDANLCEVCPSRNDHCTQQIGPRVLCTVHADYRTPLPAIRAAVNGASIGSCEPHTRMHCTSAIACNANHCRAWAPVIITGLARFSSMKLSADAV